MTGYGAYGLETPAGLVSRRWAPLLANGWCIGQTFLRGGGDHTEAWAKAGRREGRVKTLEDYEALVKKAQTILHIGPQDTVIYGRSAGGLLMGGTLTRHPGGSLMGCVYAEVPYVDELRTTTNVELPLTRLEYNEFGAPLLRLEDFISVARLSPADSASVIASPKVFVFARTAENDSQVYAYESVKWVRRLRLTSGRGAPKICLVEKGQGHFTPPDKNTEQWCLDSAILDAWVKGELQTTAFKKSQV
jgi:oligopeptidase B